MQWRLWRREQRAGWERTEAICPVGPAIGSSGAALTVAVNTQTANRQQNKTAADGLQVGGFFCERIRSDDSLALVSE